MKTKEDFMYGCNKTKRPPSELETTAWIGAFLLGLLVGILVMGPP